jgi:UPF0271 protein
LTIRRAPFACSGVDCQVKCNRRAERGAPAENDRMHVDLNCDLGEGCGLDEELMPLITSANVACGFHAGDPLTALAALRAAARCGVQVGAHPGFADREHFGRRELALPPEQVFADCVYQVGALAGLGQAAGLKLAYLKPHGALYNMACRDDALARPVVEAAQAFGLALMALPGSRLEALCAGKLPFVAEGFADRRYLPDGSLAPRSQPGAFVADADEAVAQAVRLIGQGRVRTLCVHGDNPQAVAFVRGLRAALEARGVAVRRFGEASDG